MPNLNRVETSKLLKRTVKQLVEKPDAELRELGEKCDSVNRTLADQEEEKDSTRLFC